MSDIVDQLLEPSLWFLAGWSCRWALLISVTWVWLRFLPPKRASVRHLICFTALVVGLMLPMMPAWQVSVWLPSRRQPVEGSVAARPLGQEMLSEHLAESLTVPDELPPDHRESSAAMPRVTIAERRGTSPPPRTTATISQPIQPPIAEHRFGTRRFLVLAISILWATGVVLGFSRLVYGMLQIIRLRRGSVALEGPSSELLAVCSAVLRSKRNVRLASHPIVSSPFAVGLLRPVVLVPEDWHHLPLASRRASLMHEIQHLVNYDDWLALFRAAVGTLFFFHPLVHWLLWRIGYESELICDDAALGAGVADRDYAQVLLWFAQRPTNFQYRRLTRAACSLPFGNRRTIKRRLSRLLDPGRPWTLGPLSFRRRVALTVACFVFGGALGGITLNAAPQEADRPPAVTADIKAAPRDEGDKPPSRPTTAANTDMRQKAPKKRPRKTSSPAGKAHLTEPMPVTIAGTAKDQDGRPLSGAEVFVAVANQYVSSGQKFLARTTTDDAGKYMLKDVMLPVRTFPPKPEVVEGKFQVFGVADDHGFAWHGVRAYRPRQRPAAESEPDMDRAFYQEEAITNDLVFGPTVRLAGQVMDDLGSPVAGAKVQIGCIDDPRRSGSKMYRFQMLAPDKLPVGHDGNFTTILYMPESRLSTTTDAAGRYEFAHVPREASFIAAVSATPELGQLSDTVNTGDPAIKEVDGQKTVVWDPKLTAPRNVAVHMRELTGNKAVDGVVLHAFGRNIRFAGNEARSDGEGRARLRLPPGHYRLLAEPASGSRYVRSEQEIDVAKESIEQEVQMSLQTGALVVVKAALEDGTPVEGVRFSYESDTSRDRHELQSQTVFVDHPATGPDGTLRAVIEPGRRRFFVLAAPDGYEAAEDVDSWTEVAAAQETNVLVKLKKKPQADAPDAPASDDDLQRRLRLLWRRQNDFKFKGTVTYEMTHRAAGDYVVTRDEVRKVIATFDANAGIDIVSWINQQLPELDVRLAGPYKMIIDGKRHRRDPIAPTNPGTFMDIEVFNGAEIVRTNAANAQVSVEDYRLSFVHIDGIDDLRRWPHVPRPIPEGRLGRKDFSRDGGKVVCESQSDGFEGRMVVDEATGFLYENSFYQQAAGSGRDAFQFAPIELADGMIWPRLHIELNYHKGELYTISMHAISSIEPKQELPADAFVVSLPAGTIVLASDFGEAALARERNQPGSPKQGMATGPVTDAVQFAYSLSPKSRTLWPVLKIGQDAPALNAAAWLTADGQIEPPDLKGKIVLVDFWGQGCGPCVAELPKLVSLAKAYAKTDLQIVGWHDSDGGVEGVAEFARKHGLPYLLAIDHEADEPGWFGALFKSFGVRGIPQVALLDRQQKVIFVGNLTEAVERLENLLKDSGQKEPPR